LVECIGVEFKFELNSNRFELVRKKETKQESRSAILSFLSHSFFSQSFLFFSIISVSFSVISTAAPSSSNCSAPPVGSPSPFLLLPRARPPLFLLQRPGRSLAARGPAPPQCTRSRPTDQPRRRPHLLEAEPQSPEFRKSVVRSAFSTESTARMHRATPPPLKHQAASRVTSLNRDRNPNHAQLALAVEFHHDCYCW
jgi:hypothetical protein